MNYDISWSGRFEMHGNLLSLDVVLILDQIVVLLALVVSKRN